MLWILGGLAVTVLSIMASANGGVIIVAWGAILYGIVQLMFSRRDSAGPAGADDLITDVSEGVRALIAVSAGVIRDPEAPTFRELETFQSALQKAARTMGILIYPIPAQRIGEISRAMMHEPAGLVAYLKGKEKFLTPEFKAAIVRAAFDVAAAERSGNEAARLMQPIAEFLKVDGMIPAARPG